MLFFYDNRDNNDNGLLTTSTVLSVDNNKNNFYQPKGWLPLETCLRVVVKNTGVVDELSLKNKA